MKRMLAARLAAALAAAVLMSCGGSSSTVTTPGKGTLFTFVGDAPFCDVLSFRVLAAGSSLPTLFLRRASTTNNVVVIPSTSAIKINFGALRDFSTVLNFANIPAGTYDQATIIFSGPSLVVYDPTQNPPIRTLAAKLPKTPPVIAIEPNLVVSSPVNGVAQVSALQIDFDLLHSVQLDASGQVTGTMNPVMSATPVTATSNQGFGEMDDVLGVVAKVDTFSSTTRFIGDLGLQLLEGTGISLTVNLTSDTAINGVINCGPAAAASQSCSPAQLSQILTDSFAEVDGYVGTDGNFVANSVEIEDAEETTYNPNMLAFLGDILTVTRDSNGNVTQFTLYVREEEPEATVPSVPLDSVVVVNPSSSTTYQFSSHSTNFTNLTYDPQALTPGQEVVVHGVFTTPPAATGSAAAPLTTVAADKVYLKLQSHQGSFVSLLEAAGDDKTGAFTLAPCATLFNHAPILVLTNSNTTFLNVGGLNELTAQSTLVVKGLLFYDLPGGVLQGSTINNVTVSPGTLVLVAKQVHQVL